MVIEKKRVEYGKAKKEAEEAIEIYDNFHLYLCLIGALQVFDKHGNINERKNAETTVWAALDLMSELNNESINKEVKTIRQLMPELFSYLDEAGRIVEQLENLEIPEEVLKAFCIAWQYQKNRIKAKNTQEAKQVQSQRA